MNGSTAQQFDPRNWNGGLTQVNPWANSYAGDYPFVNFFLNTAEPKDIDVSTLNSHGLPTARTKLPLQYGADIPSVTEVPGDYILDWVGGGVQIALGGSTAVIVSVSSGCEQINGIAAVGTNCIITLKPTSNSQRILLDIQAVGTPELRQLRLYPASLASALGACARLNKPTCFNPRFEQALLNAPFGVIRFMDKGNGNVPGVATWADRTPVDYWSYASSYYPSSIVTTSRISPSTAAKYSLTPNKNFSLVDKVHIIARFGSATNSRETTVNTTVDVKAGSTLIFSSVPSYVIVGMHAYDTKQGNAIQPTATVASVTRTTVVLSCPAASHEPDNCIGSLNGSSVHSGDPIYFSPMLTIDGGKTYRPMANPGGSSTPINFSNAGYTLLTFDRDLNEWLCVGTGASNVGLKGGWPPEVMVQLANEVRAHPWLVAPTYSVDPPTDYTASLASYVKAELNSGLIPRFEGPNEVWNTSFYQTQYAFFKEFLRNGLPFDSNNAYGQWISQLCQTVSSVYANNRKFYQCIAGFAPIQGTVYGSKIQNDARLQSPTYVSRGGSAAYNWVTGLAFAPYWQSIFFETVPEVAWAYVYHSAAPSMRAALVKDFLAGSTPDYGGPGRNTISYFADGSNIASFPVYKSYIAAYRERGIPIAFEQYEGGYGTGGGGLGTQSTQYAPVLSVTSGNPTILTIAPNWRGYISGTALTISTSPEVGSLAVGLPVVCSGCAATTILTHRINNSTWSVNTSQSVGNPASPVAMTGDNAWDYIYNKVSLREAITTSIAKVCPALDNKRYSIISATKTTITIAADTTRGCPYDGMNGTAAYDNSPTYMDEFENAILTSPQLASYELKEMLSFRANGGTFPSFYELSGTGPWSVFYPNIYTTGATPKITAAREFQTTP
jgi:hypothetical protein